jgi:peptide/nickel transport system permease protein
VALVGKIVRLVAVLFALSVLTYLLVDLLPGDPARLIVGPSATPSQVAEVRHQLHLDRPLPVRYGLWLKGVLHGDLGRSNANHEKVTQIVGERVPVTLELLVLTELLSLVIAIPVGIYSAYRANTTGDKLATTTTFGILSIPDFVIALVLILIVAVKLHWLPASGYVHLSDSIVDNLRSLALPTVTLSLPVAAVFARLLRSDMIATLQEDYILMARAEGLPARRILLRHALRPSSFSLLTVAGINAGSLVGGAVIIEFLFALPGMGSALVTAISGRDYLVVQGIVLLIAAGYVLINFLVDFLYAVLDPRTRYA